MKHLLYILALLTATTIAAQQYAPQYLIDDCPGKYQGAPYYYCDCWNTAIAFSFPIERVVKDTMWYTATVDDVKQGVSANWYSNVSVTMEVYPFCTAKAPYITLTVGPNQMRELEVEKIQKKIDEMGEMAKTMMQTLTPRIRIYPHDKGQGTVYCYPYDQGPHSTCEKTLPVFSRMTNVCSEAENVYQLVPARMHRKGRGFIAWKQKDNLPATIYVTQGSCTGPEIGRAVLTDSTHVMVLDSTAIMAAKTAKDTLYIHVEHPADYVGRMTYHGNIIRGAQIIDTTFCQGMRLELHDTVLTTTTVYTKDTLFTKGDTLKWTTYKLTVTPPDTVRETLRYKASQLPKSYNGIYIPKDGWGTYEKLVHKKNTCDKYLIVTVEHNYTTENVTVDTTVCQGKGFAFGDHLYLTDTTVVDSAWTTPDIWEVANITVRIQAPETEFDTIQVKPSSMQAGYFYKPYNITLTEYGDTLVTVTKKGECDRLIKLTVEQGEEDPDPKPDPDPDPKPDPDPTTSINQMVNDQCTNGKYIRDGQLIIRRNGEDYDLLGRKRQH